MGACGSVTPMMRMPPHIATTTNEPNQLPTRHEGSLNFVRPGTLPIVSVNMKRATRVPASIVVRMNSASNMIAK